MALFTLAPYAKKQFFDDSGDPLSSGRIYTYAAGTSSALTTYQTSSGTAWGAYVQLDSAGRPETGDIYLQPGQSYKFIAQNSAGVDLWTQDNIGAVPPSAVNVDITGAAGEGLSAGDLCYIGANGNWFKADADAAATSTAPVMGFCVSALTLGATGTFRTDGQIELGGPLTPEALYYVSATAGAVTSTAPSHLRVVGQAQSTTLLAIALNPPVRATINHFVNPSIKTVCNGRLTLTTGVPVTTGDVTAATTLYWALYKGNAIGLYTGTAWELFALAQLSIAVPATTTQMYDVFVDYNAGTPVLSLTAWTNDTTRATALTTQDGILVLTGATGKRYVGSFRTTGVSGQTEDSVAKRYVWNYYNEVARVLRRLETTSTWTYTAATFQQANAAAANQVEVVVGVSGPAMHLQLSAVASNDGGGVAINVSIGEDSTTTAATGVSGGYINGAAGDPKQLTSKLDTYPAIGWHRYVWLEKSTAAGTTTWSGTNQGAQSGLTGSIWG